MAASSRTSTLTGAARTALGTELPALFCNDDEVAAAILEAAGLSFLGLGAQPPTPEWGTMLTGTVRYLQTAPHLAIIPGVAIV